MLSETTRIEWRSYKYTTIKGNETDAWLKGEGRRETQSSMHPAVSDYALTWQYGDDFALVLVDHLFNPCFANIYERFAGLMVIAID